MGAPLAIAELCLKFEMCGECVSSVLLREGDQAALVEELVECGITEAFAAYEARDDEDVLVPSHNNPIGVDLDSCYLHLLVEPSVELPRGRRSR